MIPVLSQYWFESLGWIVLGWALCFWAVILYSFSKSSENFVDMDLLNQVYKRSSTNYTILLSLFLVLTFLFFVFLAAPYSTQSTEKIKRNGIDIEIVFDLSYSMIANDIQPNRLEAAKNVLRQFISRVENDRVWLVLFSGKPFQSIPLTYDYTFIENFIWDLQIETINQSRPELQGTAIGDWLVLASDALTRDENEREKVMILITDWEANKWVNPELALKYIKDAGIKVYTIWVWQQWETTIELPSYGWFTQTVRISGVDEEILTKIAEETGWFYERADSEQSFQKILDTIANLEKKELETQSIELHSSLRYLVVLSMLLILLPILYFWVYKTPWKN